MKRLAFIALLASSSAALAQQPQDRLNLSITAQELNVIVQALGEAPYNRAAPVLTHIQQEIQANSKPQPKPEPDADKPK